MAELQLELKQKIHQLEDALVHVKTLQGILPICAWCKKIREDDNYWRSVEEYIVEHSDASFSHSICPECREKQEIISENDKTSKTTDKIIS